jgi:hypothetical protein
MRIGDNIVLKKLDDGFIAYAGSLSGKSRTSVVNLNGSSAWLLSAMSGREFSADDALAALLSRYEVDEERARKDVGEWISVLSHAGIIEP